MITKILIVLAVLILALVVVIATRPADFRIERSTVIASPPEAPFALVNDFRKWGVWSPWEHVDPQLKRTYEGPESGAGAMYAWAGNQKAGAGKMKVEQSDKPSFISIRLEFLKPFKATNTATFAFAPSGDGTKVTWAMQGKNNFMAKAFGLFVNVDKLVGGDFEKGLAAMKAASESEATTQPVR